MRNSVTEAMYGVMNKRRRPSKIDTCGRYLQSGVGCRVGASGRRWRAPAPVPCSTALVRRLERQPGAAFGSKGDGHDRPLSKHAQEEYVAGLCEAGFPSKSRGSLRPATVFVRLWPPTSAIDSHRWPHAIGRVPALDCLHRGAWCTKLECIKSASSA